MVDGRRLVTRQLTLWPSVSAPGHTAAQARSFSRRRTTREPFRPWVLVRLLRRSEGPGERARKREAAEEGLHGVSLAGPHQRLLSCPQPLSAELPSVFLAYFRAALPRAGEGHAKRSRAGMKLTGAGFAEQVPSRGATGELVAARSHFLLRRCWPLGSRRPGLGR